MSQGLGHVVVKQQYRRDNKAQDHKKEDCLQGIGIHYRPETAQQREENNNDIGHNHGGSSVQVGKGGDDQDNPRHLTGGPSQIIPHGH